MRRITLMLVLIAMSFPAAMAPRAMAQNFDDGSRPDTPKYSIYFPGGTLEEYCQVIREVAGANIVTDQHASSINMPKVAIGDCTVTTLLNIADRQQKAIRVSRLESDKVYLYPSSEKARGGRSARVDVNAEPIWIYLVTVDMNGPVFVGTNPDSSNSSKRGFNLEFKGGSAIEYVNAIREAYPKANILAMPGLEEFPVPAANLQDVTVSAALQAINNQRSEINGVPAEVRLERVDMPGSDEWVFTLSLKRHEFDAESAVWSVGEHFELGVGEADLLSAVNAVLAMNDQKATVRFHPETRLIMVRGRHQTLEMVEETLDQVLESAWSARKQYESEIRPEVVEELRARIAELEHQLSKRDND